jgi:hypothetical protein
MTRIVSLLAIVVAIAGNVLASSDWTRKRVGEDWTWCESYVYAYATYTVACEPNRQCQVGMGLFLFGEPRGEKIRFSGRREITVIGAGSLHVRAADGKGPVKVAFSQKSAELISTGPIEW